ncbi:MAG: aspartate-semialdehyde dehydrogenase [Bacillota bacterium]|nr:aspartate-semialdehyde dehydrogenase [Bacillota bacterium]
MVKITVGVVGAMGAVGTRMIKCIEESKLEVLDFVPLDVKENAGKSVSFRGTDVTVLAAEKGSFKGIDIALFSAGGEASAVLAPIAAEEGCTVIDNSSQWRMTQGVPLVVPEVNSHAAKAHKGIIANPNCSTIQMLVALKPLHDLFRIRRIVVSTYQAVSGTGLRAIKELEDQTRQFVRGEKLTHSVYPHQILFNCIPHIDVFMDNGFTKEEMKMVNETRKILEDDEILVCPTAVRVPVFRGHSESINIETEKPMPSAEEIKDILAKAPGVAVSDDRENDVYPMPVDCRDRGETFVGRIRRDPTVKNGLSLWVVSDNLMKGAAYNATQIAELLCEKGWIRGEKRQI